jgi:hypothetical protein
MKAKAFLTALLLSVGSASAAEPQTWEGWVVGRPCLEGLQIADCPLRFVDSPVLLLADGQHFAFRHGEEAAVKPADVDTAYGRRVRLQGKLEGGVIVPDRIDVLEATSERKFFKGCL